MVLGAVYFVLKLIRAENYFEELFVAGVILFRGVFVLGGFLTVGFWLGGFCPGVLKGSFDRLPKKWYSKWKVFPDLKMHCSLRS